MLSNLGTPQVATNPIGDMDATQNTKEIQAPPQGNPQSGSPDIVRVLWRWKWLPILGGAIGLTVGYLYYNQQPPQYQASALVNVDTPGLKKLPIDGGGTFLGKPSLTDELIYIRSDAVLLNAVDAGKLTQNRKLAGRTKQEIAGWLKQGDVLNARFANKDASTNVIQVSVTTDDAELSGIALQAVIAGYQDYVSKKMKITSDDAIAALNKYNDMYETRKENLQREKSKLERNTDLLWSEGKPIDPSAAKVTSLQQAIINVETKTSGLEALLEQVNDAIQNQRPAESILRLIASSTSDAIERLTDSSAAKNEFDEIRAARASVYEFDERVVSPVRWKLALEEENNGPEHPAVKRLRQELGILQKDLDNRKNELASFEKKFAEELGNKKTEAAPSFETQLNSSLIALREELGRLTREKQKYLQELGEIKPRMQANSIAIANFLTYLAQLEALSTTSKDIETALNKLDAAVEYGQKSVNILEMANVGGFVGPQLMRYLGMGGFLGFAVFCGLAYLLELADRSYRSPDEIANDLGMPIIGHLPLASLNRGKRVDEKIDSSVVTLHRARSSVSEAFRGIRTAIFFNSQHGALKVIQVTSPIPGDGKSTIASNLAVSISQSGRRVCLVDCDFRRPRVSKILGLASDVGLVQVINEKAMLEEAIQQTTIENLFALSCGRRPGNPSELLSSERFHHIVLQLREMFDYVILDTPPVLVVSDPATVSTLADGVILTVRLRRNLKPIAVRAAQMLHSMNANMIGVVVNGVGVGASGYGYGGYRYDSYNNGYGYGYGYGKTGYGGYGYGGTYQYGGYYGGTMVGRDYYTDEVPKPVSNKPAPKKVEA
jgi:polysaccharide biosynthesis transport protein